MSGGRVGMSRIIPGGVSGGGGRVWKVSTSYVGLADGLNGTPLPRNPILDAAATPLPRCAMFVVLSLSQTLWRCSSQAGMYLPWVLGPLATHRVHAHNMYLRDEIVDLLCI